MSGNPEVEDFHIAVRAQHDVLGFDVAVNNPGGVRSCKRLCDLSYDIYRILHLPAGWWHRVAQRTAFYQLRGDKVSASRIWPVS